MTRADGTEGSVSVRNAGRRCDWEVSYLSHKGEGKPLRDAASRGRRRSRTCGACAVHAGAVGTRTRIQLFRDDWRLHRAWRAFKRSGPATPAGAATACRCPSSARGGVGRRALDRLALWFQIGMWLGSGRAERVASHLRENATNDGQRIR
jgi:hypothetical protein